MMMPEDIHAVLGPALERLRALPLETDRRFEVELTDIASRSTTSSFRKALEILIDEENGSDLGYAAFYCLNVSYRRNKDFTLLQDILDHYRPMFGQRPTFQHLNVLFQIERGLGRQRDTVITMAFKDAEQFPDNAGFVHLFADTVASVFEESDGDMRERIRKEWVERALEAAEQAIDLDRTYAKYYSTKARLLAVNDRFDDALEAIRRAIDLEDSTRGDYPIRIGNYQYHRLSIQARRNDRLIASQMAAQGDRLADEQNRLKESVDGAVGKMDDATLRNLEFLGFFAGLVSFTIGSIQIAANQPVGDAARLIIVLMGSLLVAFAGLAGVIGSRTRVSLSHPLVVGLVGAVSISIAFATL